MLRSLRAPAAALLLSALTVPTVHAGAAPHLNSGQASVLVTSLIVVSVPLATSMGLAALSKAPFKASERNGKVAERTPAVPLPPMEVKQVATTAAGERQVHLQVPDKADQTATLQWPAIEGDDPVAGFVVGQQVRFDPTDAGAGWTVKNSDGKALAYVPTAYAAGDALSEQL
ncbi:MULTISPECIES: hypothetical protein [Stenotrophomonas]|jgi:hypothetical protein|uniref:hypothetical protein n=1 Tax=Stenotrophomonas TaxID=40323 RepID=UPI000D3AAE7F|nr:MULTISPECIES: hypothetical protein [Stenotrophomonas]PTT57767.1 hypothetical protein DBR33_01460 [Stenotrophomonas sp. HMWF022]PTS73118.1 hypothetical protein DBR20_16270 [Stenotrophomonas sp. HMWF023]CAH0247946.1 hypothetical protein SRABI122_03069 [Stenotrophomonas lactitubi]CAH0264143.1 hypothetical protein SRABI66_03535 [Stenotrophomonas lactitubi]CAH0265347.1 hypothetical protein SRABI81_03561 [Stenotrophomonas lactitubi]